MVLRVQGVRGESEVPYAGVYSLLRPLRRSVPALPGTKLVDGLVDGLERGVEPGEIVVSAAVLNLLCSVGRPVLVCVDDLDLLDAPSREALLFAARRLAGERVAMVFAAGADVPDIPSVRLERLDERARRELVDDLAPGLGEPLRAAIDRIARGNPLAVTEVVAALSPDQLAGHAPPPEALPRDGRLAGAYAAQIGRLPMWTRDLLLLLAADPGLELSALVRAAEPECASAGLEPAELAGVVRLAGDRFRFVEPNVGVVVYQRASSLRRRGAHRRLGAVLDGEGQELRRAWHRAVALDGPGERLGEELAAAAGGSRPGTGHLSLSVAFERAADLSAYGEVRAARLASAAQHAWLEGRPHRARVLLGRLRSGAMPEELRQKAELIRARLELRGGATTNARDELLAVAESLLGRDRDLAVRALIRAGEASYLAGDHRRFVAIARDAARLRRPDDRPAAQLMFDYLTGLAASFLGRHTEAATPLRRVVELALSAPGFSAPGLSSSSLSMPGASSFGRSSSGPGTRGLSLSGPSMSDMSSPDLSVPSPSVLVWAACASLMLGDDVPALQLSTRAVETARALGALTAVPQVLEFAVNSQFWMGRYAAVTADAAEGLRLAQETGQRNSAGQHLAWLAMMAAVQGDEESCRIRADAAIDLAGTHGVSIAGALSTWALAQLDLSRGRASDVLQRLKPSRTGHLVVRVIATPTLVEAAVRTGERDRAEAALAVFERWADSTRSPDRRALAVRCRALLAGPGAAGELFREALDLHRQGFSEFETARTELLFGSALRRERRPGAAREHLRGARDTFERLGARIWAEQAGSELRATGETVRQTRPAATHDLTAQQLQIARLVADGATNREVAARLYLSPRTIEHHLRNIFTKLDIRSRVELVRLLG
ncbi:helix-turn-helix transcriptional regulator [Acrocarpospora phusangensis]|uniref:helix-turn-helix transcriptional regulator n=1 Tax=Acrocarpospora phusangensis TaxID=1070424 RepID=UPI0035A21BE3